MYVLNIIICIERLYVYHVNILLDYLSRTSIVSSVQRNIFLVLPGQNFC